MALDQAQQRTDKWKSDALDVVFNALALCDEVATTFVYKGARVLRILLDEYVRASLDIDAALTSIAASTQAVENDLEGYRSAIHRTVADYFEQQDPVRLVLQSSRVERRRKRTPHPKGWDVYCLYLHVQDLGDPAFTSGAPALQIDIAGPEATSAASIGRILLNGRTVLAVTLERMAGEKLRAFLSHLPAYRAKLKSAGLGGRLHPPRVKDLYDLARICRKRPPDDAGFWTIAGQEFVLACGSRAIDCAGMASFRQNWALTRQTFERDPTIPKDVSFEEAEDSLQRVVGALEAMGIFPLVFEI